MSGGEHRTGIDLRGGTRVRKSQVRTTGVCRQIGKTNLQDGKHGLSKRTQTVE